MRATVPALAGICLLAALAALYPTAAKGIGPRPGYENLLAARALGATGIAAIEDGHSGTFLGSAEVRTLADAGTLPATTSGNRLTVVLLAHLAPEHPSALGACLWALAAACVALAGARVVAGAQGLVAGALFILLPVAFISASSPGHVEVAGALAAIAWCLTVIDTPARVRLLLPLAAGILAGLAALARDSYVVLAPMLALVFATSVGRSRRQALVDGVVVVAVAAALFAAGGGLASEYVRADLRGRELFRLGHAFPDFFTYEAWRDAPAETRASDPRFAEIDPRLASIYAGLGDPTPGGWLARRVVAARAALSFYPRALVAFDAMGGPVILLIAALGALAAWRRGAARAIAVGLSGGGVIFLAFHAFIGTSNESHLAIFAAPLAVALADGVAHLVRAAAVRTTRPRLLGVILVLALAAHLVMAARVGMSRLYNGAGDSRYGTSDQVALARAVAAAPFDAARPRVLVGGRGEDGLAVAWIADRSVVLMAPSTLLDQAERGDLARTLEERGIGVVAGYDLRTLRAPAVLAAFAMRPGLVVVEPQR